MATNKRKDSAALFELIDKSTLKVPKNAGALKIPSWWSSKTNPPSAPTTLNPPPPAAPNAGGPPAPVSDAVKPKNHGPLFPHGDLPTGAAAPSAERAAAPVKVEVDPLEALLHPAPTAVTPAFSPSISAAAPVRAAAMPVVHEPAAAVKAAAPAHAAGIPAGVVGSPQRPHAPPLSARSPYPSQGAGSHGAGNMQKLALIAGGVLLLIVLVAILMLKGRHTTPVGGSDQRGNILDNERAGSFQAGVRDPNTTQPAGVKGGVGDTAATTRTAETNKVVAAPPARAAVVDEKSVKRDPALKYLIIASYRFSSKDAAQRAAEFLAANGVSTSIVPSRAAASREPTSLSLVSVEGFPPLSDQAEAFRKKVVALGKQHPDSKKHAGNSVFPDAYFSSINK